MSASAKVYEYPNCSTCKKALKWLDAHGVEVERVHIVDAPPSAATLKKLWKRSGLELGKFFNRSGQSYRNGNFKDKLPTMSEAEQLAALAADGKLIKRPLLVTDTAVLVGFSEDAYAELFDGGR